MGYVGGVEEHILTHSMYNNFLRLFFRNIYHQIWYSASSVLLFILFMDGLFPYLRDHCSTEELIKHFHALVHADDTIIISTSRDQFITKCNHMLDYFSENSLKLNFDKSSYFIINPKANDRKSNLQL